MVKHQPFAKLYMLEPMPKPAVFNLDDFCEDIMTPELWALLHKLKEIYPNLKITMFTIPLRCTLGWLTWVHQTYPWIEMHYHGTDHVNRDEWFEKTTISLPFKELFYPGFKAPWWRMDQITADTFSKSGFLISARRNYFNITNPNVYYYNIGHSHIPNVWYENQNFHAIHSHVQHQKLLDGLPDGSLFTTLCGAFSHNQKFLWISEWATNTSWNYNG